MKRVDQSTTPWQIDFELDKLEVLAKVGNLKQVQAILRGGAMKGIYKLVEGRLVYCVALPGKPRPRDFSTPPGSQQTVVELEAFSTGEQAIERAFKDARISFYHDPVGWITSVTLNRADDADKWLPRIAKLKKLGTLYITADSISKDSMRIIGQLPTLHSLMIASNSIDDQDLQALSGLVNITSLTLNSTQVTDAGLQHLVHMKKIYNLRLGRTHITDKGLDYLRNWPNLSSLQLDHTLVTDKGMKKLSATPQLSHLRLEHTAVTDQGLAGLKDLTKLHMLSLAHTAITDGGIEHLRDVGSLHTLNLSGTRITDASVRHLSSARKIRRLNLNGTRITDESLQVIARSFPVLHELRIAGSKQLTDKGLLALAGSKRLTQLYVTPGQFLAETGHQLKASLSNLRIQKVKP